MKLKKIRESKKKTQAEIAKEMKVSQQAITKWENNNSLPRADKLVKLAKILDCTIDELLME